MAEYPKIETLYERDPNAFVVNPAVLRNPIYDLIKTWEWTEKIDGTNIRCEWDHETRQLSFAGRTDAAQIHADLVKWLYTHISPDYFVEHFPDQDVTVYGEGYGAGIQKGGGDYSPTKQLIVFDVLVGGKWWLTRENVCAVAEQLGVATVPYLGEMTLADATTLVRAGFPSRLNGGKKQAEGMVGRTAVPLFDRRGKRLIIKLKTQDFRRKDG